MGMLKKIVRGTLAKLTVAGATRQQLVLNGNNNSLHAVDDSVRSTGVGRYTCEPQQRIMTQSIATSGRNKVNTANGHRNVSRKKLKQLQKQQTALKQSSQQQQQQQSLPRSQIATAIPEAVLMAAKNRLPPVQFHHVHGPNAQLSKNNCVVRRTQSFCQALVFSNRVIWPNERVYIKVLEIAKGWSGTIRFGFTSVDPATLRYQMPKHACPDMTKMGHTWARALADEVVRRNSVIHFSYTTNGFIHYGINNQDCGIFYANVNTNQNLWFVVDVYGLTAAVELIDPRVHNASSTSELDLSASHCFNTSGETDIENNDEEEEIVAAAMNLYKSTSALYPGGARGRSSENGRTALMQAAQRAAESLALRPRKRDNKQSSRQQRLQQASVFYEHFLPPNGQLSNSRRAASNGNRLDFMSPMMPTANGNQLPNLSSVIMPTAQQNIYSPMPGLNTHNEPTSAAARQQPADTHDYYQISMSNTYNNATLAATADAYQHYNQSGDLSAMRSQENLRSNSVTRLSNRAPTSAINEDALCHQLDSVRLNDSSASSNQQQVTSRQTKSSTPIAATRKRLQQQPTGPTSSSSNVNQSTSGTTSKRSSVADKAKSSSYRQRQSLSDISNQQQIAATSETKPTNGCTSSAKSATKSTRSSSKKSVNGIINKHQQSVSTLPRDRNNNNNSPISKDCPICFERPINCVLYQCGHMCTCYECGVKQWRTQSRTCPICRTVIKDVIKTYMS